METLDPSYGVVHALINTPARRRTKHRMGPTSRLTAATQRDSNGSVLHRYLTPAIEQVNGINHLTRPALRHCPG